MLFVFVKSSDLITNAIFHLAKCSGYNIKQCVMFNMGTNDVYSFLIDVETHINKLHKLFKDFRNKTSSDQRKQFENMPIT